MRNKILRYIGIFLMIIGVMILGAAFYMKYDTYKEQRTMKMTFENLPIDEKKDSPISDINKNSPEVESKKQNNITPIAILTIPKLDVDVVVGDGVTDYILQYAVGKFPGSANPGEKGNFSVAGHRDFVYAEYFKHLDKLVKGDEIKVKTKKGEFVYEVTEGFVVEPTEVEVLKSTNEPTITLITCTQGAKQRYIVKGKLVQKN